MRFEAKHVSASEAGDYYQVAFETDDPGDDRLDPPGPDRPYLIVQRQFEMADGGRCYLETHDEAYIGHYRLRLLDFTREQLIVEIARKQKKRIEVSFAIGQERFDEVKRVIDVIFGKRR